MKTPRKPRTVLLPMVKTYATSDFSNFKLLGSHNRSTRDEHVRKLMASFHIFGTHASRVIVVESKCLDTVKTLYVADGQHSIEAVNRLNAELEPNEAPYQLNVMVVKLKSDNLQDLGRYISALNNNSNPWKGIDYVKCFAANGIHEYVKFNNAISENKSIGIEDLQLIYLRGANTNHKNRFKSGKMQFTNETESDLLLNEFTKISTLFPSVRMRRNAIALMHANGTSNYKTIVDQIRFNNKPWSIEEVIFQQELAQRIKVPNMIIPFVSITGLRNDLTGPNFLSKIEKSNKVLTNVTQLTVGQNQVPSGTVKPTKKTATVKTTTKKASTVGIKVVVPTKKAPVTKKATKTSKVGTQKGVEKLGKEFNAMFNL